MSAKRFWSTVGVLATLTTVTVVAFPIFGQPAALPENRGLLERVAELEKSQLKFDVIHFYVTAGHANEQLKAPPKPVTDEKNGTTRYTLVPGDVGTNRTESTLLNNTNLQDFLRNGNRYECPGDIQEIVVVPTDEFMPLKFVNCVQVRKDIKNPQQLKVTGLVSGEFNEKGDLRTVTFKALILYKPKK